MSAERLLSFLSGASTLVVPIDVEHFEHAHMREGFLIFGSPVIA
jgi:hypothetical protein